MEIGLLLCDAVPEALETIDGTYLDMFQKLLPGTNLIPYNVFERSFPDTPKKHPNWIISGSRYSVYDDIDWINKLKSFTSQMRVSSSKCLGVCFGHQLIAEALGGQVQKARSGWEIGVKTFQIESEILKSKYAQTHSNILMMCQDQVVQLPLGSEVLATSDTCPIGMYMIGEQFLAIQGHPEYSKEYDRALIQKRKEKYEPSLFDHGLNSLTRSVDYQFFQKVILEFLK